jgi:hypothetical protein
MSQQQDLVLNQTFTSGYNYTRSTGPIVGQFLTQLRQRKLVGIRGSDGKVIVPPVEYDPVTADELNEFVSVKDTGIVQTWSWVNTLDQNTYCNSHLPGH